MMVSLLIKIVVLVNQACNTPHNSSACASLGLAIFALRIKEGYSLLAAYLAQEAALATIFLICSKL